MSYTLPCKYTRLHLGLLTTVTVSLPDGYTRLVVVNMTIDHL